MTTLLLLLLFPAIWPFIAQRIWGHEITVLEMFVHILFISALVSGGFYYGRYVKIHDVQILNGEITSKDKHKGTYTTSHKCGKSTCHTTHYTVDWIGKTTVGQFTFLHLDSTWPGVWAKPDPVSYTNAQIGDPASIEDSYDNYIKGAPDSLFNSKLDLVGVPVYPMVHDIYKIDRVLNVNAKADTKVLNEQLNMYLKKLGPSKQVNIVVIQTENGREFKETVENGWIGGKKNDVIVFLGLKDGQIVWTDAITWAHSLGNDLFDVELKDSLENLHTYDPYNIALTIANRVGENYKRPSMDSFDYLKYKIEPSEEIMVVLILISILGSLLLTWYFYCRDFAEDLADFLSAISNND